MNTTAAAAQLGKASWRTTASQCVRWALPCLLVLGLTAMVFVLRQINDRAELSDCRSIEQKALKCLDGLKPSSLTLELAGSGERLACQLRSASEPEANPGLVLEERICTEARIRMRWDELTQLDTRWFMPAYGLFSLLIAASLALQPSQGAAPRRALAALAIVASTVLLLVLDRFENTRAMALLIDAERGPLEPPFGAALNQAAASARQASLVKWLATGLWAAALAFGLKQWMLGAGRRQRWARQAAMMLFILTSVACAVAVGLSCMSDEFSASVNCLHVGLSSAFLAAVTSVAVAWMTPAATAAHASKQGLGTAESVIRVSPLPNDPAVRDFHLEEYRQLRGEVVGLLGRIELLFRAAMIVAATAFAWLVLNSLGVKEPKAMSCLKLPRELLVFAWLIPPTFVLCTGVMALVAHRRVGEVGVYLRMLEQALGHASLGWEAYLSQKRSILTSTTQGLWSLLFILTIAATLVGLITLEQAVHACLDN